MTTRLPFEYRDFYDRPRALVVRMSNETLIYLDSSFDESADEYEPEYTVCVLPASTSLSGSWKDLRKQASATLGKVAVSEIEFDPTFRIWIDVGAGPLARLLNEHQVMLLAK